MKSITRFTKNLHGNQCLNCGTSISEQDNFCSNCGQVNDLHRLSVKQYFSEYLSGFYSFDNRFLRTVIPLLIKPGQVSKNYVNGRRMYYVNPFQLYLHITILFFLLLGIFETIDRFKLEKSTEPSVLEEIQSQDFRPVLDSIKEESLKEINNPDAGLDSATVELIENSLAKVGSAARLDSLDHPTDPQVQEQMMREFTDSLMQPNLMGGLLLLNGNSEKDRDSLAGALMAEVRTKSDWLSSGHDLSISTWSDVAKGYANYDRELALNEMAVQLIDSALSANGSPYRIPKRLIYDGSSEEERASTGVFKKVKIFMDHQKVNPKKNVVNALEDLGFEVNYWNVFFYDKAKDLNEAIEDPEDYGAQFLDRVLSKVSVALFFLLPVFTLIVSLLYLRSKYNYTENLVFVFHVQTVFFLLLMIYMLAGRMVNSDWTFAIFITVFAFYIYKALRNFYGQGRFKTTVKFILLNFSFIFLASIGAVIVSFLTFFL